MKKAEVLDRNHSLEEMGKRSAGIPLRFQPGTQWMSGISTDPHGRVGEFGWGGMASTHYWVSPKDELVVVTMEQTLPFNWNLERTVKPLAYGAIVD